MPGRFLRFALGFAAAILFAGGAAEGFLRWAPPVDLHLFLGDASPLQGHLAPGGDFGVRYQSLDDLVADNPETLGPDAVLWRACDSKTKTVQLFLGSSFGFNLCGRQRVRWTDIESLHLDRREMLHVRMAQVEALARAGVRVDRAFLVTIPLDLATYGEFGLEAHTVVGEGGAGMTPRRPPGVFGPLIDCRLGMAAWVRNGRHLRHPSFRRSQLGKVVPDHLKSDLERMFAGLERIEREHAFPVTVVLVPQRPAVLQGAGFAADDAIAEAARKTGVDVVDPRAEFLAHPRRADLYIVDGHLSAAGDDLVLDAIEQHITQLAERGRR